MNLCIPRISTNIEKKYIYDKISSLEVGKVERLIEIPLKNNPTYKRILFKITWNDSEKSQYMQEQLNKLGLVNFVYEMPWYWKIFISNSKNKTNKS